jgi:hypothetical protein
MAKHEKNNEWTIAQFDTTLKLVIISTLFTLTTLSTSEAFRCTVIIWNTTVL